MGRDNRRIDLKSGLIGFLFCLAIALPALSYVMTRSPVPQVPSPGQRQHPVPALPTPTDAQSAAKDAIAPFVRTVPDGVWRTVDPGGSGGTLAHAMHPVTGTILVTSDMYRSLLRSRNGTRAFEAITPEGHPTLCPLVPHPERPGVWYAGYELDDTNALAKSEDDGETWTLINREFAAFTTKGVAAVLPDDTLIWEGPQGLMISRTGGASFEAFDQGLFRDTLIGSYTSPSGKSGVTAVTEEGRTRLYLACAGGLYQRDLGLDAQWRRTEGLPARKVTTLAFDPSSHVVWVGFITGDIYHKSADKEWIKAAPGPPDATILRTHPLKPGWVWCFSHGRAGLFRSRDMGQTWEWLTRKSLTWNQDYSGNVPPSFRTRFKFLRDTFFISPENPDHLYLGQIYLSTDGGKTWQFGATDYHEKSDSWHGNGLSLLTSYKAFWDDQNPDRVYLGFSDTGLMRSDDRGETVRPVFRENYPDMDTLAYWKDLRAPSAASCMAFAADPEFPETQYYGMSCKGRGKNVCGMLFRTDQDGRFWFPLLPSDTGFGNGIITDLDLLPCAPFGHRKLYALVNEINAQGTGTGILFLSRDQGKTFIPLASSATSPLTFPLMDLDYCKSLPDVMYLTSSTRGGKRPARQLVPRHDNSGGIFISHDSGEHWTRSGGEALAGAVQVAVDPGTPDVAYAAVVSGKPDPPMSGGIYKTVNGGQDWELVLNGRQYLPEQRLNGPVSATSVAINPAAPAIVYGVIDQAGVFRSVDGGKTWDRVDWPHLKRYQGSYHTLSINPHDPAEFYLSTFGNAFLAFRDPVAASLLKKEAPGYGLVSNGDFELTDRTGRPVHWTWHPGTVLRVAPSPGKAGQSLKIKTDGAASWLTQQLSPYAVSLMRGHPVTLSYEVFARKAKFVDLPVLSLVEIKKGEKKIRAELPASLAYVTRPYHKVRISDKSPLANHWKKNYTTVQISPDVNAVELVLFTSDSTDTGEFYIDNIHLELGDPQKLR